MQHLNEQERLPDMSDSNGVRKTRAPSERPLDQRLVWIALAVGLVSVMASFGIGYLAYTSSRDKFLDAISQHNLALSRSVTILAQRRLQDERHPPATDQALKAIADSWREVGVPYDGTYLCVIEAPGRLALHTKKPKMVGTDVSRVRIDSLQGVQSRTVADLLKSKQSYAAKNKNFRGQWQLAGYSYMESIKGLVVVHVPVRLLQSEIESAMRPWAISLAIVTGLLIPGVLVLMHVGYSLACKKERSAMAALRDSEGRYRALVDVAPIGVQRFALSGQITFSNRAYTKILGYDDADLVGKSAWDFELDPVQRAEFRDIFTNTVCGNRNLEPFVRKMRHKTGHIVELNFDWNSERDGNGDVIGLIAVISDVTETNRVQAELRDYAVELEDRVAQRTSDLQQKNLELESFSQTVSHDLGAPLRAMHGFALAMQEDFSDQLDEDGIEYTQHIIDAASRMERLIHDLLSYSRLNREELRSKPTDLQVVVDDALRLLENEIELRQADVYVDDAWPIVVGDRTILTQMVVNLLSNALKFVAEDVTPNVRLCAEVREEYVRLWVEDNGIGICPEHCDRIFSVFERLHGVESYPGTGIGLAIVSRGAERMGGRAGVESDEGVGSRFWVELPMSAVRQPSFVG